MRRRRLVPFALLAALGGTACRERTTPAPAPSAETPGPEPTVLGGETRALAVGELGKTPHFSASADSLRECPMEPPFSAKAGFVKLGVELTLTGTTGTEVPANPFYASLTDPSGNAYAATLAGCEPPLPAVRVSGGKAVTGYVTFEVPKAVQRFELKYAPAIIGAKTEELRFSLRR